MKPRIRVPMGRQRLDSNGLKLYDPLRVRFPWMFTETYRTAIALRYGLTSSSRSMRLFE